MNIFWTALALVLVIEGLFPFASPSGWRNKMEQLTKLNDGQIRFFAAISISIGVLLLCLLEI